LPATGSVVPLPHIGSHTSAPGLVVSRTIRSRSLSGFCVGYREGHSATLLLKLRRALPRPADKVDGCAFHDGITGGAGRHPFRAVAALGPTCSFLSNVKYSLKRSSWLRAVVAGHEALARGQADETALESARAKLRAAEQGTTPYQDYAVLATSPPFSSSAACATANRGARGSIWGCRCVLAPDR
jgi:hypothetical protein